MAFSQGNCALFWSKIGHFRRFGTTNIRRDFSKGLDVKWHIPSTCLDASTMWFSTGICSINRTFKWLWLKTRQTPQNGQNVHRFQVRTPICHIVPVSRAYPPPHPHTRQKYEQKSGQNMTPNPSKQGKFGSLRAMFLFILLPCMWGLGFQRESLSKP